MQFTGKLNEADLSDVRKITRSKMYWLKIVLANWYGTALVLIIAWVTISGLLGHAKPNWQALAIIWLVIIGIVFWNVYSAKRKRVRELARLNDALPDQISLTNDGVKLDGPNGAAGFLPWRNFKGWREGQRVVLVEQRQQNCFVILPVAQVSDHDRQPIRQFLRAHISVSETMMLSNQATPTPL